MHHAKAKPKRRRHPHPTRHARSKRAIARTLTAPKKPKQTFHGAALAATPVAATGAAGGDPLRPLIIVAISMSLMLFGVVAAPPRAVPWRRAADFVHERNVDLTLVGVVLLAVAALTMLLTKG